jgi:Stigma-specific protein, Stig1
MSSSQPLDQSGHTPTPLTPLRGRSRLAATPLPIPLTPLIGREREVAQARLGSGSPDCCDGACRDLLSDFRHCGACDAPACTGASSACCGGACHDLTADAGHCGASVWRCEVGAVLHATAVVCASSRCVATACESGDTVVDGACCDNAMVCGTAPHLTCWGNGQSCCGGVCVDTSVDPNHCGDCNQACPEGAACAGGFCTQGSRGESCGADISHAHTPVPARATTSGSSTMAATARKGIRETAGASASTGSAASRRACRARRRGFLRRRRRRITRRRLRRGDARLFVTRSKRLLRVWPSAPSARHRFGLPRPGQRWFEPASLMGR